MYVLARKAIFHLWEYTGGQIPKKATKIAEKFRKNFSPQILIHASLKHMQTLQKNISKPFQKIIPAS